MMDNLILNLHTKTTLDVVQELYLNMKNIIEIREAFNAHTGRLLFKIPYKNGNRHGLAIHYDYYENISYETLWKNNIANGAEIKFEY